MSPCSIEKDQIFVRGRVPYDPTAAYDYITDSLYYVTICHVCPFGACVPCVRESLT